MKVFFSIIFIVVFFLTCKKIETNPADTQNEVWAVLTPEQDSVLASIKDTVLKPSDIVFFDGETLEEFLKRKDTALLKNWGNRFMSNNQIEGVDDSYKQFLAAVFSAGTYFTKATNFSFQDQGGPIQIGIGYVYGSKDYTVAKKNGDCTNKIHGLDCSGLLKLLLERAGVQITSDGTSALSDVNVINAALAATPAYTDLKYKQLENKIPANQFENGDIVYFLKDIIQTDKKGNPVGTVKVVNHIGIVASTGNITSPLFIYQSNGTNSKSTYQKDGITIKKRGCEFNLNKDGRGPHCIPISKFITWDGFTDYKVLRLIAPSKPNPPPALSTSVNLTIIDGDNQNGTLGMNLPKPLIVKVTNANGNPIKNVPVTFKTTIISDKLSESTTLTNNAGIATVQWTLMDVPDRHSLTINIKDENNKDITKTATASTNPFIIKDPVIFVDSIFQRSGNCAMGFCKLYLYNVKCKFITTLSNWSVGMGKPYAESGGNIYDEAEVFYFLKSANGDSTAWVNPYGGWSFPPDSGPLAKYLNVTINNGIVSCEAIFWISNAYDYDKDFVNKLKGKYRITFKLGKGDNLTYGYSNEMTAEYK